MPTTTKRWFWNQPSPPPAPNEVRASVRFPLRLPVEVTLEGKPSFVATTENISASGMLINSAFSLVPEDQFEFTLQMPAAVMGTDTDVVVHGRARVVRCYQNEPHVCAAAVIDDYSFEVAIGSHGRIEH